MNLVHCCRICRARMCAMPILSWRMAPQPGVMVGRHRGEHDVVDLLLGDAGVLERLLRRAHAQVAGRGPCST